MDDVEQQRGDVPRWWPKKLKLEAINNYAVLMGYLSMALRGLAFLVITWTTVILLGGFVSVLEKKDFWCLTVISLAQIVGVFDVNLNENLSNIGLALEGLISTTLITTGNPPNASLDCAVNSLQLLAWVLLAVVKAAVQALLLGIVLLPLAVIYIGGLYISMGISLWRLIQRDYGIADEDDSKANLKPALVVLYSLALVQGVLFCYRSIYVLYGNKLVEVLTKGLADDDPARDVVRDYLRETSIGCEKHPSFATGRNLAMHAVELIESNSPSSFLRGSMYLDALIRSPSCRPTTGDDHDIIKQLVGSTSSSRVLQKLMATLDPRSPYSDDMRKYAMTIVSHHADEIRLERFPRVIQCITSLIRSPMEQLVQPALRILERLAAEDVNFIVMSNTQGFLSCIMAPLTSNGVVQCHLSDTTWHSIAEMSLQLISRFMAHGTKLRGEITNIHETVSVMEHILKGDTFCECLQKKATEILMDLPLDKSSKRSFISLLINIFVDHGMSGFSRIFAGERLLVLSVESTDDVTVILTVNDDSVHNLTTVLLDAWENMTFRIKAAEILKHLSAHYTEDERCFETLKITLTRAMPQVLTEMLNSTGRDGSRQRNWYSERQKCTTYELALQILEKKKKRRKLPSIPCFPCLLGEEDESTSDEIQRCSFPNQRDEYDKLKEAMMFLCETICDKFINDEQDLGWHLHKIATRIGFETEKRFTTLDSFVKEATRFLE